jgi:L-2,4-diaminobutyrate decarboxylase
MDAWDPVEFRALGHRVVDRLADHLESCSRRDIPVLPWATPDAMLERWPAPSGGGDPLALIDRVIRESNHLHHPRYVGHQVTSPLPLAALAELVAATLNNSMAVYEMGPVSTAMERRVIEWMGQRVGMRGGVLTSGGSLGNLTALLAARNAHQGVHAPAILVSSQAHYCMKRAAFVMGFGDGGAIEVPVDDRFQLDVSALPDAMARARQAGRTPIAVVASACSTATGAFDSIREIAAFARREGLWLHVDGAHGAAASLSERYRSLLDGIEQADSVVWDAHKMMLVPSLSTAVLFRDERASYELFAQEASYLFADGTHNWWDIGMRTLECTKRMMALPIYLALAVYGERFFDAYVTQMFDLARRFATLLREDGFDVPTEPMANIVCFRLPGRDSATIRRTLIERGEFHLVQTRLGSETYLRTTLINPRTTEDDLVALIRAVKS